MNSDASEDVEDCLGSWRSGTGKTPGGAARPGSRRQYKRYGGKEHLTGETALPKLQCVSSVTARVNCKGHYHSQCYSKSSAINSQESTVRPLRVHGALCLKSWVLVFLKAHWSTYMQLSPQHLLEECLLITHSNMDDLCLFGCQIWYCPSSLYSQQQRPANSTGTYLVV